MLRATRKVVGAETLIVAVCAGLTAGFISGCWAGAISTLAKCALRGSIFSVLPLICLGACLA